MKPPITARVLRGIPKLASHKIVDALLSEQSDSSWDREWPGMAGDLADARAALRWAEGMETYRKERNAVGS